MGLEKRGNGFYYYMKEREGDRVVSRYVGGGSAAEYFSLMSEIEAERKDEERFEKRRQREQTEKFDARFREIEETFDNLIAACLLVNGYHQTSSREWRKMRNGKK